MSYFSSQGKPVVYFDFVCTTDLLTLFKVIDASTCDQVSTAILIMIFMLSNSYLATSNSYLATSNSYLATSNSYLATSAKKDLS